MTANDVRDPALPGDAILLHIGPHKTGTTALQGALVAARPQLREAGVLYPRGWDQSPQAAAALHRAHGGDARPVPRGMWLALAAGARKHPGRVVISSEMFCEADADAASRIVADLDPDRVRIAVTLRPLELLLPSSWQQHIKAGNLVAYGTWLKHVLESREESTSAPMFWRRHHHPELIRRWADAVGGADRITVVIADATRPRALFDAFEDLLDLPRATLDPVDAASNRSLSMSEAELLRQFNRQVRRGVSREAYYRLVKRGAIRALVEQRSPDQDEERLITPAWAVQAAREFSRSDVAEIAALGVNVIGDLQLLAPDSAAVPSAHATTEPATVPIELAASFAAEVFTASLRTGPELRGDPLQPSATDSARPTQLPLGARLDRTVASARDRFARSQLGARLSARYGDRLRSGAR